MKLFDKSSKRKCREVLLVIEKGMQRLFCAHQLWVRIVVMFYFTIIW